MKIFRLTVFAIALLVGDVSVATAQCSIEVNQVISPLPV